MNKMLKKPRQNTAWVRHTAAEPFWSALAAGGDVLSGYSPNGLNGCSLLPQIFHQQEASVVLAELLLWAGRSLNTVSFLFAPQSYEEIC